MSRSFHCLRSAPSRTSRALRWAITTTAKGFGSCSSSSPIPSDLLEAHDRKTERQFTAPACCLIGCRVMGRHHLRAHRQTNNFDVVAVKNAVVIDEHALTESRVWIALDLNMNQQPGLLPISQEYLDQLVCIPASY